MNYKRLIENIKYIALTHKLVNSCIEGDTVFELNSMDIVYPIVYITPQPHSIDNPVSTYSFVFDYVDRLLDDKSNRIDIHNAAIKALNDIIIEIDELENTESIKPFNTTVWSQKFADECAGGEIEVKIETYNDNNECNSLSDTTVLIGTEQNNDLVVTEENNIIEEDGK